MLRENPTSAVPTRSADMWLGSEGDLKKSDFKKSRFLKLLPDYWWPNESLHPNGNGVPDSEL